MNPNKYKFEAMLWRIEYSRSAYVIFPADVYEVFGKGLVHVNVTVDGLPFDGSIMNRGHKHFKKRPTHTINISWDKLEKIGKIYGDMVTVTVKEREVKTQDKEK